MIFNSFDFFFFLPIVFGLYWFVINRSLKWQNFLLLAASYVFYGWWDYRFLALLLFSTLLDFAFGAWVDRAEGKKRKLLLWLGVINNISVLGIFKYYNFFAETFASLLGRLGLHTNPVLLNIALPIGISFYTFHGMSYMFDIYRRKVKPVNSFADYALFVSFFPLLVAGPIERASHLLPQIQQKRLFNFKQGVQGVKLILWGLFKKIVVADYLAKLVDFVFNDYQQYSSISLVWAAVSFSFQIYGDFSGYSDIAIGTAKLFGFELLSNFRFPYFSRDIAEFWRRWHISLSSWFRDYLYIPLGGSRGGRWMIIRNTFIIFLVSGFWHGANWTFIVWGGIHAIGFLPLVLRKRNRLHADAIVAFDSKLPRLRECWQMLATFIFVTFAWIFFRSANISAALGYVSHMINDFKAQPRNFFTRPFGISGICMIVPMMIIDWHIRRDERDVKFRLPLPIRYLLYLAMVMSIVIFFLNSAGSKFIYFQF